MALSLHTPVIDGRMRTSKARRSLLRLRGAEPGIVTATPDDALVDLLDRYPAVDLPVLVSEAEMDAVALECAPKLAFLDYADEYADDAESTRIGIERLRGNVYELRTVYQGPDFRGLGGMFDGPEAS